MDLRHCQWTFRQASRGSLPHQRHLQVSPRHSSPFALRCTRSDLCPSSFSSSSPNIWTSYLYKNAPRYLTAFSVNLAAAVVAILFATAFKFYLKRENAKLDRGEDMGRSGPSQAQIDAGFRYPL